MKRTAQIITLLTITVLMLAGVAGADVVILVDFGKTETENIFGLTGWNTVIKDTYTYYSDLGPGGTTIGAGNNSAYNHQGVKGTARTFKENENIVVAWYNNSDADITFTPKISFNDPDRPASGTSGTWQNMSAVTVSARKTAQSTFTFDAAAAGTFSLVNVNVNYANSKILVCDKIELKGGEYKPPTPTDGDTVTLADFGKTASANIFGLTGWSSVIKDTYTDYKDIGPGGTTIVTGTNGGYDYQGVKGSSRTFADGEKIAVTWYNNSAAAVTFTPKISFNDSDRPGTGTVTGTWNNMSATTIAAKGTAQSTFTFDASSAGTYSLVNVSVTYSGNQVLICDKIVLIEQASTFPAAERQALIDLYNSTGGADWTNKTGWLGDTGTECSWYGVTCENNHVTKIDLSSNNLVGTVPASVGNLTELQLINFYTNKLSGTIPTELGSLTKLQEIYFSTNNLSGTVPSQLGSLTNLKYLSLYSNQLTGSIPPELGNLTNLQSLYLSGNQLTGSIPTQLGKLTNLLELSLSTNQLTGDIPVELGNLTELRKLRLQTNQLSGGIPSELGSLTNLTHLYLNENQLTGNIPPELANLSNLIHLYLNKNQLEGSIPPGLGSLTNLTHLLLEENRLTENIPSELGSLTNLERLSLYENQLTGGIPPELANLVKLQYLRLSANQLTGNIPPGLGGLTNLVYLYLHENQLTGSIPPELGSLTKLTQLYLNDNQLTGTIPPELGNLMSLLRLYLYSNQLTGTIPPELGNLVNIEHLLLSSNQLSGSIPPALGNLVNMTYLNLRQNQLTGSIPPEIGNLAKLKTLYLYSNQLSGSIPPELGNLTALTELYLNYNNLSGTIPPELGNLVKLEKLYLHTNWTISGSIPPELGNLLNIKELMLSYNQLSGTIPSELGKLKNMTYLNLQGNQLSGSIPSELGSLTSLTRLDLNKNRLSGSVPPELANLTNMTELHLEYNALYTGSDALRTFLNSKQSGGDWESSQTVPPSNLAAVTPDGTGVSLTWTPITYTGATGGYEIEYSETPGGPYKLFGTTANKSVTGITVTGLSPDTTYYFRVRTKTEPHTSNTNTVYSEYTAEVSAKTAAAALQGAYIFEGDNYNIQAGERGYCYKDGVHYLLWSNGICDNYDKNPLYINYDKYVKLSVSIDGENWTTENIIETLYGSWAHRIAIDDDGVIHIAYNEIIKPGTYSFEEVNLVYANNHNGSWNKTILFAPIGSYMFCTSSWLIWGKDKKLHLIYNKDGWWKYNAPLYEKQYDGISWSDPVLLSNLDFGYNDPDDYENSLLAYGFEEDKLVLYVSSGYYNEYYHTDNPTHTDKIYKLTQNGTSYTSEEIFSNVRSMDVSDGNILRASFSDAVLSLFLNDTPVAKLNTSLYPYGVSQILYLNDANSAFIVNGYADGAYNMHLYRETNGVWQREGQENGWRGFLVNGLLFMVRNESNSKVLKCVKLQPIDSDSDGMADKWEKLYFGDLSHDGTGDGDNDGFSDLQEYSNGTDPTVSDADINRGLVAYYPFNGNANDESGNGNNGTENGGLLYEGGVSGQAASFDGVNDSINLLSVDDELKGLSSLTVSAWVKNRDAASDSTFMVQHANTRGLRMSLETDGDVQFGVKTTATPNSGSVWALANASSGVSQNDWTFMMLVWDGAELRGYVNGTLVCTAEVGGTFSANTDAATLYLGYNTYSKKYFKGLLDDVRIYNRALSPAEIQELDSQRQNTGSSLYVDAAFTGAETGAEDTPFKTIQAAIDAASDGDIVIVANGTYTGTGNKNLDFNGKAITVRSANGAENCIIDCENDGRGFYFHNGEGENSVVSGFTVIKGRVVLGGGIFCEGASPTVIGCIFSNNSAEDAPPDTAGRGGGMANYNNSNPTVRNCIFTNNSAMQGGGGMMNAWSSPTVSDCVFENNSATLSSGGGMNNSGNSNPIIANCVFSNNTSVSFGGGMLNNGTNPTITNCVFNGNYAEISCGGVYNANNTTATLVNCTFINNNAVREGGGICDDDGNSSVTNSIFWGNSVTIFESHQIYGSPAVTYTLVQGGFGGEGNIDADPLFVDDYHLSDSSPCISAGTSANAPEKDIEGNARPNPEGSAPDMGAYESPLGEVQATGTSVYVDPAFTGAETGAANAPYNTIAEAVAKAAPNSTVRIAKGIYAESLSVANISGLTLAGGYNAGTWTQDDSGENFTQIIASGSVPGIRISNASGITVEGFILNTGLEAQNADNLQVKNCVLIGTTALQIQDSSNVSVSGCELTGISETANSGVGIAATNSSLNISGNFIHADTTGIYLNTGIGTIAGNSIHIRNTENPAAAIKLESLTGDVRVENNVLYFEGNALTGILETGAAATPAALLKNHFYADSSLIFYHDENGAGNITSLANLNNSTLSDVSEKGDNAWHPIPTYVPCFETGDTPCMNITYIPLPPFPDTDSDGLPDEWENLYFGNLSALSAADPDNDGLNNQGEYENGTDPNIADSDQDGTNDGAEVSDPNRHPLMADAPGPDIYVDSSLSGVEGGSGTATQPYRRISDAMSNAQPNSTLLVAKGEYAESLTISNISGLKIKGGWNNDSGTWTRDTDIDPGLTRIISGASPAIFVSNSRQTFIEGMVIQNGVLAQNSDGLHLSRCVMIGDSSVRIEAGKAVITYCEIIGISQNGDSGFGVVLSNASAIIDSNFIHADTTAILFNAGSSGTVINNSLHIRNLSNPGYGIRLASALGGNVHIENNVLYFEGGTMTGIYENSTAATPSVLLKNYFYGDASLIFYHDADGAGNITSLADLNNGTLSDISLRGQNVWHEIAPYQACISTEAAPCMDVTHIPCPPGADLDGDTLPDDWENHYFGNTAEVAGGDPDDDDLSNAEEYAAGTDPTNPDSDGDRINDAVETADPSRSPLIYERTQGRVIYVDAAYTGVELGTMSQPFNTIAEALDIADNGASIYIAKGSYIESLNISSLYDLEIEGGWNNNSGVWTRDENLEPTATEIIAAAPAVLLSNAPHTFIEGLFIQNGLSAENSDSLHLSRSLSIGPVAVRITGGSAILTYNEILGVSENAGSGYGVILSNAAVIIDSNFIHADTAAIVFNAGSSGLVMNNSIHLRNLSNPGYGIRLESPLRGDVHIENNVLYFEGVSMTGIYEIGDIADKVILLRNQFYGDENLIFCHEINGNITDISKLGKGNIYHNIPPYTPCFETEGLPCMTLTHIPRPPGADLDGDMLPDEWEKLYFDDTGKYSAGDDPDNDGLSNIEEYINGTDPMNRDSDQDGMNDGEEIAKERNPLMSDLIKGGGIFIKAEDILSSELSDDAVQIRWQIAETSDFSSPVLDLKTKEYLNALTVPDMVLKADTVYYARIRTYDSAGNESEWIGSLTFKTPPASNDANNNGIPDVLEIDDETSDRDHNDVADVNQTDMKCVRSFGGDIAICLKAGENTASVDSLAFADPDMISDTENRPDEMPLGLISFRITTENPGDTAEVTVYFSEPVPDNAGWYKYDTVRGWQNYSWNTRFGDDRKTAVLTLKDGGFGDADGLANGVIADPSGPAISAEIFESGVFTVGTSGIVGMDWLYDGGMYKGILGIFSLRGMDSLVSDSAAFTAESLRRILTNTEDGYVVFTDEEEGARFSGLLGESKNWNSGVYKGLKRFQMRHGDRFATVLIPNSTLSDLRGGSLSKQPLFSLATSNPDHGLHLGQIADVNGMGNAFIYEDMGITVSDKDYNDLIFQITGVTAAAPALDDLVADKANWVDWRVSEKLGKKIVEHIEMPPVREETLRLSVTLTSAVPVHLFVYNPDEDECGREGGYIAGANFEIGGNSQQIFLPVSGEGNYRVVLRGAENGTCTLSIKSLQGETVILSEEIRRVDIKAHQSLSTDVAVSFKDGGPSIEAGTPQISKGADGNPLYYDFDGNGKIDDKDIEKVKSRWHSKIGEDAYDPFYDLDNDGEISILDVTGVAYNNPRSTF